MKVVNIHKRSINQPKERVSRLIKTLATQNDLIWPYDHWPAIRFENGLKVDSKVGHGMVRYTIIDLKETNSLKF